MSSDSSSRRRRERTVLRGSALIASRDVPLLQATVLTVACVYCLVNFLADLAYGLVNPRIRYHS